MAARLELLKEQFFDDDGDVLSGGKLYTYIVGTTTEKATYTTVTGDVEQANPVVLDSDGRIPSDLYGVGAYKIVIKDSSDNTIDTIPTVSGIGTSSFTSIGDYSGDLDAAITSIGATETTLLIDETATMSANTTVPSTCFVMVVEGGSINQSTYTLTLNGPIWAGPYEVFTGTGTVNINAGGDIWADWFGSTKDDVTLTALKSMLGSSSDYTIKFSRQTWTIASDLTITSNLVLDIPNGALLSVSASQTLTINSSFAARQYQVFTGAGSVVLNAIDMVYPEMWGAVGDDTTDDYTAFYNAYQCLLNSRGGTLKMMAKNYKIDSTIELGLAGSLHMPVTFEGSQSGSFSSGTILNCSSITTGNGLFEQNQGGYVYNHNFKSFEIRGDTGGNETAGDADAFRLAYLNDCHFDDLAIFYCNIGLYITDQDIDRISIKRSKFSGNGQDVYFASGSGCYQMHFEDVQFTRTQGGASFEIVNGATAVDTVLKTVTFRNCSWIGCKYEAIKLPINTTIFGFVLDGCYSEQCCETSGDYAFDLYPSMPGLKLTNCRLVDNHPAEAVVRIGRSRNPVLISNVLGLEGTTRALDLGIGSGAIYDPVLIGNEFFDDVSDVYVKLVSGSVLHNLVTICNNPNELEMGTSPVFSISNYYAEENHGTTSVNRVETLADDATPSIGTGSNVWLTGGTTTITDFDDGVTGQMITIIAEHAITITDGTNIFLNGSANFVMAATDTLTLICKADNKWYEIARSDNT